MLEVHLTDDEVEALRERYRVEQQKRLRPDGVKQYQELKGEFEELDADPFSAPIVRDPITEEVDVVIVGGGFAGMLTAAKLKQSGIDSIRIVEKAGDFGGTWYWNRYPGCMCDVESYTYLPLLEETGYMPREKYASAPEIFAYCQLLGRHFDLYPCALFQTVITGVVWNDAAGRWDVETHRGDQFRAKFVVTAGGILHKAKLPGIPGIESFAGTAFHTAHWDYSYTGGGPTQLPVMDKLADKRVGIIGTGATAVQAIPQLARYAKEVYVFQRTPSAVGERNNGPTDVEWFTSQPSGWHAERVANFTNSVTGKQPEKNMVGDGWTEVMWVNTQPPTATDDEWKELERKDFETMEALRRRVDTVVKDPEVAAKLKPYYGKNCKRVCFHDEYLQAFNLPNVHLVDTDGKGVDSITPTGVVVAGTEYPVDCLVLASGFEVNTDLDQRLGFDPVGRDGIALSKRWSDGPHTLHGILSGGFPNLLIISLVQAGFGTNFVHFLAKSAEHVAEIIATCRDRQIATIESLPDAEEEWLGVLYSVAGGAARYAGSCTPSYYNGEQGPMNEKSARNLVYAGSLLDYSKYLEAWRAEGHLTGAKVEYLADS